MGKKSEKKSAKKTTSAKIAKVEKIEHVENVEHVENKKRVITLTRAENFAKLLSGRKHADIISAIVANIGAIEKTENFTEINFSESKKGDHKYNVKDLKTCWVIDKITRVKMLLFVVEKVIEKSGRQRATRVYITDENAKNVVYGDSTTTITERTNNIIKNSK